jgi:NSS family neurotransmitter:Na+ symporter
MRGQETIAVVHERLEQFSSRWMLLISMVGIAVGTGNIWRFPRIAAKYEGGAFLIPWLVFLFLWSIPIILMEYSIGKGTRKGTVGAFGKLIGRNYSWMGAFVGFVSTAIMFYYAVVNGWCLRYLTAALSGNLKDLDFESSQALWNDFINGYQPVLFHFVSLAIAVLILYRGVVGGIEKANRVFVPALVVLLLVLLTRAVTLPEALKGIQSFFTIRWDMLMDYRIWLDALTQNAWSTGAGWGLILTYAVYMRKGEDTGLNSAITAFANHSISLAAGLMIFATVYALIPSEAGKVISDPGPLNTGLAFIWIPILFSQIPGGYFFSIIFFLALFFASMSSLISMIELAVRVLSDAGMTRTRATIIVSLVGLVLGVPSALNPAFFLNQDWVWGLGLIVSGAFFTFAVLRFGVPRFRQLYINSEGYDVRVGRWYDTVVKYCIPVEVTALIGWWFWAAIQADPNGWWNPLRVESVGTCLIQWGGILALLISFNSWITRRTLGEA